MKIRLALNSTEAKAKLKRWGGELRQKVQKAAAVALTREAPKIKAAMQAHVGSKLKVARPAFLKTLFAKVMNAKPDRLPALHVGSKVPWLGIHENGGTIKGKLLIPLHGRVGRKQFKAQIAALRRGGNAYFVKAKNGNLILMAENQKEYDRPLSGFKRRYRKATGAGRLKRGEDVPIAVLVSRVTIKRRLDVIGVVKGRMPELGTAIERQFKTLS